MFSLTAVYRTTPRRCLFVFHCLVFLVKVSMTQCIDVMNSNRCSKHVLLLQKYASCVQSPLTTESLQGVNKMNTLMIHQNHYYHPLPFGLHVDCGMMQQVLSVTASPTYVFAKSYVESPKSSLPKRKLVASDLEVTMRLVQLEVLFHHKLLTVDNCFVHSPKAQSCMCCTVRQKVIIVTRSPQQQQQQQQSQR